MNKLNQSGDYISRRGKIGAKPYLCSVSYSQAGSAISSESVRSKFCIFLVFTSQALSMGQGRKDRSKPYKKALPLLAYQSMLPHQTDYIPAPLRTRHLRIGNRKLNWFSPRCLSPLTSALFPGPLTLFAHHLRCVLSLFGNTHLAAALWRAGGGCGLYPWSTNTHGGLFI